MAKNIFDRSISDDFNDAAKRNAIDEAQGTRDKKESEVKGKQAENREPEVQSEMLKGNLQNPPAPSLKPDGSPSARPLGNQMTRPEAEGVVDKRNAAELEREVKPLDDQLQSANNSSPDIKPPTVSKFQRPEGETPDVKPPSESKFTQIPPAPRRNPDEDHSH